MTSAGRKGTGISPKTARDSASGNFSQTIRLFRLMNILNNGSVKTFFFDQSDDIHQCSCGGKFFAVLFLYCLNNTLKNLPLCPVNRKRGQS